MPEDLSSSVRLTWKFQTERFESAEVSVSLYNITAETTPEEMDAMLDGQVKIAYAKVRNLLTSRAANLRDTLLKA